MIAFNGVRFDSLLILNENHYYITVFYLILTISHTVVWMVLKAVEGLYYSVVVF